MARGGVKFAQESCAGQVEETQATRRPVVNRRYYVEAKIREGVLPCALALLRSLLARESLHTTSRFRSNLSKPDYECAEMISF